MWASIWAHTGSGNPIPIALARKRKLNATPQTRTRASMHIHYNLDDQHSQPLDIPWDDFESYLTNPDVDPLTLDQAKKSVDWPQ